MHFNCTMNVAHCENLYNSKINAPSSCNVLKESSVKSEPVDGFLIQNMRLKGNLKDFKTVLLEKICHVSLKSFMAKCPTPSLICEEKMIKIDSN